MADPEGTAGTGGGLDPDDVSGRTFATAFRGFDPVQVRSFLGDVADELRRLHLIEDELRAAADAPGSEVPPGGGEGAPAEAEAAAVVEAAKAEADRLLRDAKDRVAALGSAATAETTRVLEEARSEAERIRARATDTLKGRAEEAEATAVRKIAEAEREAAAIRVKAREAADATIEAARERGREMVGEAQAVRERMLADLAKRKRAAQAQLEQLRAGRDRLLDTLRVARRAIDEMTTRFDVSESGSGALPPASGTPSGSVTTTPGAASTDARPRVASGQAGPAPAAAGAGDPKHRPIRTRAVAIGEAPSPAPRPSIAAPHAGDTAAAGAPAPVPEPAAAAPPARRPASEERRSSALRILRRNRPAGPPPVGPPAGRESHGEGVRIIGRPPEPAPEPEPGVVVAPVHEGEPQEDPVPMEAPEDVPVEEEGPAETGDLPEQHVDIEEPAPPDDAPPLVREEIRPRIEDLFARIRADREATTAAAREVLGMGGPSAVDEPAGAEVPQGEPVSAPVAVVADVDENRLQRRDATIDPLVSQLTKRLKRALQDEQNASLDRLRTSRGRVQADDVLSRVDDQSSPYRHLSEPFLEQAAQAGASASPFGAVAVPVEDLAHQLASDLAGALRSRLAGVLSSGASDDLDLATLSERISNVYREWKVSKVERLAVHYLVAAHERGGFLSQPEETPLRWLVDDDGPCPDCDDNALAGPTPRGQAFPTGQLHPPAHLGCRCLLSAAPT